MTVKIVDTFKNKMLFTIWMLNDFLVSQIKYFEKQKMNDTNTDFP